ncbi:MAG: SRPBCC domain-containing protein [Candidatus Eiseniibacteriota bacterium]|jgi:uncharacterized protein YndB with AHSA1/START domain
MTRKTAGEQAISDGAVEAKTGRSWKAWFEILERWGARQRSHRDIARYLRDQHDLGPWWAQTVTVRYEQDHGRRAVGQRADGTFELGMQRTIRASRTAAFEAFTAADQLGTWFTRRAEVDLRVGGAYENADGDRGTFLAIERPRRLRFTWDNPQHCPGTMVEVTFEAAETASRGTVVVRLRHRKLRSREDRESMLEGWSWALDSLRSYLETGRPITHEAWLAARHSGAERGAR